MNQEKMAHLWTSPTCHHRYDHYHHNPNPDGNIHPIGKAMLVFSSLDFLKPPQIFHVNQKSEKLWTASNQTSIWKKHWVDVGNFEESETKRIQQNEKRTFSNFCRKTFNLKDIQKLKNAFLSSQKKHFFPNFVGKFVQQVVSFPPPPKKKWSKKTRRKITNLASTSNTEARPLGAASGHHYGKYRGARRSKPKFRDFLEIFWGPGKDLGGRFFPLPGKPRNSYHFC